MGSVCTVCGKGSQHTMLINYSYTLLLDALCDTCHQWLDKFLKQHKAIKSRPFMISNPNVLYYEDRNPIEIKNGKDFKRTYRTYPVYLP